MPVKEAHRRHIFLREDGQNFMSLPANHHLAVLFSSLYIYILFFLPAFPYVRVLFLNPWLRKQASNVHYVMKTSCSMHMKSHIFLMRFIYIVFQRPNIFHFIVIVEVWKLEYKLGSLSLMFLPKLNIIIKEKNNCHLTTSFSGFLFINSSHLLTTSHWWTTSIFYKKNSSAKAFWKQVICLHMKN